MDRPSTPSLVVAVAILLVGALATFALTQWQPERGSDGLPSIDDGGDGAELDATDGGSEPVELVPGEDVDGAQSVPDLRTTVAWPLEVEFDLLEDRSLPPVPAGDPLGSGREAQLSGRIADARGEPVRARVRFVEGVNAGRELDADAGGRFGASDLVPGMAIVEVSGPNILGSRREVRLRSGVETLLNIGYGRPGTVQGSVVDEDGEGVADALVRLDGLEQRTDEDGDFYFLEVAAGRCLLEIEKDGFVDYRTLLGIASAYVVEPGMLKFVLRRPATLKLTVRPNVGGPGPALAYLMPASSTRERSFPWHLVNPVEVAGDGTTVVNDLPEGAIHVRVYRSGAVAKPEYKQVYLSAGHETDAKLRLEPAPVVAGAVFGPDGEAAIGATVRITAADVSRASRRHFPAVDQLWLEHVLPLMPSVDQTVVTDASGRFRATSWSNLSPYRLLEATAADGRAQARVVLGPEHDDQEIAVHLTVGDLGGDARFRAILGERTQALPVDVAVNGTPRERTVVPPDRALEVDGLTPGVYRVRATWQGRSVATETSIEIVDTASVLWELPPEAIEGQSPEEWRRMGRPYPGAPPAVDGSPSDGE